MKCPGCPHNAHFGRCCASSVAGRNGPGCECPVEATPLPYYVPTAAERGYADDDAHQDWIETGEGGSTWLRDEEDRREAATHIATGG